MSEFALNLESKLSPWKNYRVYHAEFKSLMGLISVELETRYSELERINAKLMELSAIKSNVTFPKKYWFLMKKKRTERQEKLKEFLLTFETLPLIPSERAEEFLQESFFAAFYLTSLFSKMIQTSTSATNSEVFSHDRLELQSSEPDLAGVKLSFLRTFLNGNDPLMVKATTKMIAEHLVKPLTANDRCSFVDLLQKVKPDSIGTAEVFISHSWLTYKFVDLIKALDLFYGLRDVVVWMDLFCYNQHEINQQNILKRAKSAIKKTRRFVMVLAPLYNPVPLTRGWCVWELFCALKYKCIVDIAMTEEADESFIKDFDKKPKGAFQDMLSKIDCEKMKCSKPEDEEKILLDIQKKYIQKGSGFDKLNKTICEELRKWIVKRYEKEYNKRVALDPGKRDNLTLQSMHSLGRLCALQGEYSRAEELYKECRLLRTETLGDSHADTLAVMNHLAGLYQHCGRYEEAKPLYLQILDINQRGTNIPSVTNAVKNNLAMVHDCNGESEQALELCKEALAGNDNAKMGTLKLKSNLALIYSNLKQFEKAEELYLQCLNDQKSQFPEHSDTLVTMYNLASFYLDREQFSKAEPLYKKCLRKRRLNFGDSNPDTLMSMHKMAFCYSKQGKLKKAKLLFKKCLKRKRKLYGNEHKETFLTLTQLAYLYFEEKKYSKAKEMVKEALHIAKEIFKENDPEIFIVENKLFLMYCKLKQFAKAESYGRELYARTMKVNGESAEITLITMNTLALCLNQMGNFQEAESLYLESLRIKTETLDQNHPSRLITMKNLALMYDQQQFFTKSAPLYQECYDINCYLYEQQDHSEILTSLSNLAVSHYNLGDYAKAEPLLKECLDKRIKKLGNNHPDTLISKQLLADVRSATGKQKSSK